ncbi:MAG: metal ABC transporter permease [Planctomycetaceae bacterium]
MDGSFGWDVLPMHLWTIATAIVGNAACAIAGCYLVLRRMSLLGDAISHSILAAIGVVFLLTGGAQLVPIFIGAIIVGVLTGFLTQLFHNLADVPEDTSMGVVFTTLFAFGVVIISQFPNNDLDVDCVLMGKLEFVTWQTVSLAGYDVPEAFLRLGAVLLLTIGFVFALWKELKIASFDGQLATAMGFNSTLLHYLLMALVAIVTVTSLESIGAIVVIAMLIVPPATAHLLTDRILLMLFLSVLLSITATVLGHFAAYWVNSNTAGMIAVAAGVQFTVAVFFAPQHGLLGRGYNNLRLRLRIVREDILSRLYRMEETKPASREPVTLTRTQCIQLAGGSLLARMSLSAMQRAGQVVPAGDGHIQLTDEGRREGRSLLRSHRLWESYISKHFDLDDDHLHEPAHRVEHYIGPKLQNQLAEELDTSSVDPHGREIPPPENGSESAK